MGYPPDVELSEQELDEIAEWHRWAVKSAHELGDLSNAIAYLGRLLDEVHRLREIETAAARVNDVWHGFDETEKFKAWRALNIALAQKPSEVTTFTCEMCGGTYERVVSDEATQAEYEAVFGEHAVSREKRGVR